MKQEVISVVDLSLKLASSWQRPDGYWICQQPQINARIALWTELLMVFSLVLLLF